MGRKWKDHTGQRFGKLVAIEYVGSTGAKGKAQWRCVCDCGGEKICKAENLLRGKSKSCGCDRHENRVAQVTKHGHARGDNGKPTTTYRTWHSMLQRCLNENTGQYEDYGGRGITVCDRWRSFENFLADMGEKPSGLTLDRIDVNGNYELSNCRWATQHEQAINKRPRMKHGHVLKLIAAARQVVAANDNEAVENLKGALRELDRGAA